MSRNRNATPARMGRMMERIGVDLARFARVGGATQLSAAINACGDCSKADTCATWLSGEPTVETPATFCPNYDRFASVTRR